MRAFVHMHCNRVGIDAGDEERFLAAVVAVVETLRFATTFPDERAESRIS